MLSPACNCPLKLVASMVFNAFLNASRRGFMFFDVSKMNRKRLCTVCSVGWARTAGIMKKCGSSTAAIRATAKRIISVS